MDDNPTSFSQIDQWAKQVNKKPQDLHILHIHCLTGAKKSYLLQVLHFFTRNSFSHNQSKLLK